MTTASLSTEELRKAIEQLSVADMARLSKAARIRAAGTRFNSSDLLNEAVRRALDGRRTCPRAVGVTIFLENVMRSIVSAARDSAKQAAHAPSVRIDADGVDPASDHLNPEECLVSRDECDAMVAALEEMFSDHEQARLVIMGVRDGMGREEIMALVGLSETEYATIRRFIRRKIHSKYPKGWQS